MPARGCADRPTVAGVIRDLAELRESGQVWRYVADLDVDVETWRAGMRRAARRERMRIRTFLVHPHTPAADDADLHPAQVRGQHPAQVDDQDRPAPGLRVYAVRTDLEPDLDEIAAVMDRLAADQLGPTIQAVLRSHAPVASLADARRRRRGASTRPPTA